MSLDNVKEKKDMNKYQRREGRSWDTSTGNYYINYFLFSYLLFRYYKARF